MKIVPCPSRQRSRGYLLPSEAITRQVEVQPEDSASDAASRVKYAAVATCTLDNQYYRKSVVQGIGFKHLDEAKYIHSDVSDFAFDSIPRGSECASAAKATVVVVSDYDSC